MASFKGYDRDDAQKRRLGQRKPRRNGIPRIEFLENRQLLTTNGARAALDAFGPHQLYWMPRTGRWPTWAWVPSAFTRRMSIAAATRHSSPPSSQQSILKMDWWGCKSKALEVTFHSMSLSTDVGMQITTASSYYDLIDGYAPINALPTIAEMPQTMSGQPLYKPVLMGTEYQGKPTTSRRPRCTPTPPEPSSTSMEPVSRSV